MSPTVLFFGNERLATGVSTSLPVLKELIASGYNVAAIVVAQSPQTKSRQTDDLEIIDYAREHHLPVLSVTKLSDQTDRLAGFKAQAAVLAAFGLIVPGRVINLFPSGIINLHPSLLPKHRGPTPIESTILAGDSQTGVSIMKLTAKLDAGPVYKQASLDLTGRESKQALADKLGSLGADLLSSNLENILDGRLKPWDQAEELASYDRPITKADGQINWHQPALHINRQIRAYAGWPRSQASLGPTEVVITSAEVVDKTGPVGQIWQDTNQFGVYCSHQAISILSLIPAGKKDMAAPAFLAGHKL